MPPNLQLVITSRSDLPFPVARLRARREMVELRAADLRFTAEETTTLFDQATDSNLDPQDIAILERRTVGWITGLQLATLGITTDTGLIPKASVLELVSSPIISKRIISTLMPGSSPAR